MALLCVLLLAACVCDYRWGRIPNGLVILILNGGVLYRGMTGEPGAVLESVCCILLMMLFLYPVFRIGALGAGDVKLFGACAGFLPVSKLGLFLFVSLLTASAISLIKMVRYKETRERFCYFWQYLTAAFATGHIGLYLENERERKKAGICLSGPILVGILLYVGGVY